MHPSNINADIDRQVEVFYKNSDNEPRVCRVIPHSIVFMRVNNVQEWVLDCTDVIDNKKMYVPMRLISKWVPMI